MFLNVAQVGQNWHQLITEMNGWYLLGKELLNPINEPFNHNLSRAY